MLGLPTFWIGVISAGASLSERPLQDGGDISKGMLLDVSLTTYLSDHRLVLVLVDWKTSTKLMQKGRQLVRMEPTARRIWSAQPSMLMTKCPSFADL